MCKQLQLCSAEMMMLEKDNRFPSSDAKATQKQTGGGIKGWEGVNISVMSSMASWKWQNQFSSGRPGVHPHHYDTRQSEMSWSALSINNKNNKMPDTNVLQNISLMLLYPLCCLCHSNIILLHMPRYPLLCQWSKVAPMFVSIYWSSNFNRKHFLARSCNTNI